MNGAFPVLVLAGAASDAQAHGFGQRFDLPLPLWLWLTGAGATIVLTFAALALFARRRDFGASFLRSIDLLRFPLLRRVAHPLAALLRAIGCALFALILATGFYGSSDAYANLTVTMVWVLWWVGMAFFCALIGDLWDIVNPLPVLYRAAVRLIGCRESLGWTYPARWATWPAVALFFAFAWAELIWQDKDVPRALATALLAYSALSWVGMLLFGVEAWRRQADAFAMVFRVLGRFAPLELRGSTPTEPACLRLRPYAAGLLTNEPVSNSMAAFVLLMLATVTFDGFHETPLMDRIGTAAQMSRPVAETLFTLSSITALDETQWLNTVLLLLFPLGFVLIFRGVNAWMLRLAGATASTGHTQVDLNVMVWSLVPIAVAYHLAHYASLLLTTGQFIIPLASDPFGWGWNLFGTRGRTVDLGIVSPAVYWYVAVTLIVVGHVLAVIVAHVEAARRFESHRAALMSQLPMLALMVAYTSLSLWIMAQPIVG
ncbi:hypothetical protein EGT29_21200 [Pigmentiphaga sp. H8]|uniref:hypothetical protein n=1 Tax=Pigmentiphaga sp. H8 TaxID=2488560 RepID=UPI000F5A7C82|nr:hypothetical protein [Pigmentiphaga sp. H8]AZG10180.1 hypothetical protein EGT29_21200 [Pigmentiphaga sp. H8]